MVGCFAAIDPKTISELKADPDQIEGFLYPDDGEGEPANSIDVDKAWHGIHYLLNRDGDGGGEPLCWAIFGGDEVGDDLGYGPARILQPDQVKSIAGALIDESVFKSRYAPEAMEAAQIYPEIIWVRDGDEALGYLVENYRELVTFYRAAAERGDGVVLWLS
jgi:hypothetical protein